MCKVTEKKVFVFKEAKSGVCRRNIKISLIISKMAKKKVKKGTKKTAVFDSIAEKPATSNIDDEVIPAAITAANQAVFMKVCRLCESKEGPFLNIFDANKSTAKKIDDLMPFAIAETDSLSHKICFRCSAKVEELYEFVKKCVNTQHSLHTAMGNKGSLTMKAKTRAIWEEKLNKSNMSNDDICDALIKKAMEGIKDIADIPLAELGKPTSNTRKVLKSSAPAKVKTETKNNLDDKKEMNYEKKSNDVKLSFENESEFIPVRASRSKNAASSLLDGLPDIKLPKKKKIQNEEPISDSNVQNSQDSSINKQFIGKVSHENVNTLSIDYEKPSTTPKPEEVKPDPKEFNIMDYIAMIKVNGVGVLFQCKLCNRNFLKKDIVLSHACAKNGVPKTNIVKRVLPPEPPKPPVVKYINTNLDGDIRKQFVENKLDDKEEVETRKIAVTATSAPAPIANKSKPKIGPASKTGRLNNVHNSVIGMTVVPMEVDLPLPNLKDHVAHNESTSSKPPSVNFPSIPCLNSRYKLVAGPNNTFQLLEDAEENNEEVAEQPEIKTKSLKKRKIIDSKPVDTKSSKHHKVTSPSEVVNLDADSDKEANQPYPVGLFQTMATPAVADTAFLTPAMKKQSYTIVQTGNPSKLLLSTKPQPVLEETSKKKAKKNRSQPKVAETDKQPFSVTIEDVSHPKEDNFFTFINVDPLLQPSYVLPTNNIIQESQISTSTPINKPNVASDITRSSYSCNMCGESFSREKKLLSHIQSHYSKMDEEDQKRVARESKRRSKK